MIFIVLCPGGKLEKTFVCGWPKCGSGCRAVRPVWFPFSYDHSLLFYVEEVVSPATEYTILVGDKNIQQCEL